MLDRCRAVAIVGVGFRLPGDISTIDTLWDVLINGKNMVTEIGSERWATRKYLHPRKTEAGKSYTFKAGVLSNIDEFDASFFGISPREAQQMDPQQRMLLETAWEALENGNQNPEKMAGSNCGVFVGVGSNEHMFKFGVDTSLIDSYMMLGSCGSIASNRISYIFDLHGPSFSLDTACSSSMVALHQGCQAIREGTVDSAIVGGVNLLLSPTPFVGFSKATMLSPDGACKSFDAKGNGYVRAEGCIVFYLKSLEQAEKEGDPIHAIIENTGINSDGRTNGIAMPSREAQAALITQVHGQIDLSPDDIGYIEAHGTGTSAGDFAESHGIADAITQKRTIDEPVLLGSIKSNIGHLEVASGLAGVLKSILCFKHGIVPATVHFENPNPNINFEELKLSVVAVPTPFPKNKKIAVNSFGFGGANAHVVLSAPIAKIAKKITVSSTVFMPPLMLSARNTTAFTSLAKQYRILLENNPEKYYDLAYALSHYRAMHHHRLAVHASTLTDLFVTLREIESGKTENTAKADNFGVNNNVALVYSGNGSQWQGMGRTLIETSTVFANAINEVDILFSKYANFSIKTELFASVENTRFSKTEVAQPALFALQVAMTQHLLSQGLKISAVLGHSIGEVTAAWASGALTLEQAVQVIYCRSYWQGKTVGQGRMAAIALSESAVKELIQTLNLTNFIEVSAINSPNGVTVSGDLEVLEKMLSACTEKNIYAVILDLNYAFHSRYMDPIQEGLLSSLADLKPSKTTIDYISTVEGKLLAGDALNACYWWRNIREPVKFYHAIDELISQDIRLFIEVGPHPILKRYVTDTLAVREKKGIVLNTMQRQAGSFEKLHESVLSAWMMGAKFDLQKWFSIKGNVIDIPAYPWVKERYCLKPSNENTGSTLVDIEHPLLGYRQKAETPAWENHLDTTLLPYLADHVVSGLIVLPGACYVEMALAAAHIWYNAETYDVRDVEIMAPMVLDDAACRVVQFFLQPEDGSFRIQSRMRHSDDPWVTHVVGQLMKNLKHVQKRMIDSDFLELKNKGRHFSKKLCYQNAEIRGLTRSNVSNVG